MRAPITLRIALALAMLCGMLALFAGCDAAGRTHGASVARAYVARTHAAARKSIVPRAGRKALEPDDDDDDDGDAAHATYVRHHRQIRTLGVTTRSPSLPARVATSDVPPARPVEARAPQQPISETYDARGPPRV